MSKKAEKKESFKEQVAKFPSRQEVRDFAAYAAKGASEEISKEIWFQRVRRFLNEAWGGARSAQEVFERAKKEEASRQSREFETQSYVDADNCEAGVLDPGFPAPSNNGTDPSTRGAA